MVKKLIAIGSSTGLILDKPILELLGLEQGAEVDLSVDSATQTLRIRPSKHRERIEKAQAKVIAEHGETLRRLAKR